MPKLSKIIEQSDLKKDPVLDLKTHLINTVLRKANEFITETFLKSNDTKIDIKKV